MWFLDPVEVHVREILWVFENDSDVRDIGKIEIESDPIFRVDIVSGNPTENKNIDTKVAVRIGLIVNVLVLEIGNFIF